MATVREISQGKTVLPERPYYGFKALDTVDLVPGLVLRRHHFGLIRGDLDIDGEAFYTLRSKSQRYLVVTRPYHKAGYGWWVDLRRTETGGSGVWPASCADMGAEPYSRGWNAVNVAERA